MRQGETESRCLALPPSPEAGQSVQTDASSTKGESILPVHIAPVRTPVALVAETHGGFLESDPPQPTHHTATALRKKNNVVPLYIHLKNTKRGFLVLF